MRRTRGDGYDDAEWNGRGRRAVGWGLGVGVKVGSLGSGLEITLFRVDPKGS